MSRHHTHSLICLLSIILAGLLLAWPRDLARGVEPSSAYNSPSTQMLRDFALPTPLFASTSAWNQTAATAAVLADSDQQILVTYRVLRGDTTTLHPPGPPPTTWPFMYVNYDEYTIPVFRAGAGQADVLICDYEGNMWWPSPKFPSHQQQGGPVSVPPPAGTVRPASPTGIDSDGHLVLYHPGTFTAYDYWQATTIRTGQCQSQGGGLPGSTIYEAGVVDYFDVRGSGANPDTYYSARATGVPLLAGLLVPEDVESGAISHALAVAIPGPRNLSPDPYEPLASDYFYPASTTETDYYNTNPHALAAGQRLRLKQSLVDENGDPIDEDQFAPITSMFLAALRTYGAYVVDNAGGLIFYAEDIHSANLSLSAAEVNALVGRPAGTPPPLGQTNWQTVMEQLNLDLEDIPFAYGAWPPPGNDPAQAMITTANFEVVAPATTVPLTPTAYLPLILHDYATTTGPGATMDGRVLSNELVPRAYLPLVCKPLAFSAVNDFLYQLQNLNLAAIGDTAYDLVIMDYSADGTAAGEFSAAQIAALKHSPGGDKVVLAYMSIGEAEDYRFYWQSGWTPGNPPWLDAQNPDWPGNYKVRYWDPGWQAIVFDYTDRLLDAGFDGAYLDIIDAYEYYADRGRATAAQEMADFVAAIRAHARARDPDFHIVPQNAPELAGLVPAYLNSADGIGQEDIYYGYVNDDQPTPPAITAELESYLDVFKAAGKLVLTVDYATTPAHVDDAYTKSLAKGYVPFVTVRDLDQLIVNPGHEPD